MAGPLAGISAAQIAQQKLPDQAAQQVNKQGPSKFDNALKTQGAEKAQGVGQTQHVQQAQQIQKMDAMRHVDQVQKTDKAGLQKVDRNASPKAMDPVTQKAEVSKSTNLIGGMVESMEKGAKNMDQIINSAMSGKNFSNQELISLQAGMYKYTQELDLCSKVVEKATSGLKDTLKTQV